MKVWWARSPAPGNFGDILTPFILNYFGVGCEYQHIRTAEALCIGSIARFARDGVKVIGSGVIDSSDKLNPNAEYLFVRGPITGRMVREAGGHCPDIYGDPAMLLPKVFKRDTDPHKAVGIVAHYVDLPLVESPINPLRSPIRVLRDIWACDKIISSSLHGIIAAHAYGIPAAWVKFSDKLHGDDVKFHDYAQSVGLSQMPLSTIGKPVFTLPRYNSDAIEGIIRGLSGY